MIEVVRSNILDAKEKYIAHQINAISNRAAGLADQLFQRFPHSNCYKGRPFPYKAVGKDFPGHCLVSGDGIKERFVIGIVGQYYPGKPLNENSLLDSSIVREGYFNRCLIEISNMENVESIAFPSKIGCGLAGGNWDHYFRMLETFEILIKEKQNTRVVLYDYMQA